MTPEDLSIREVIAKLRRAFAIERQRLDRLALRYDIAHLMDRHQRDFDEGWRRPWVPDNDFYWACFEKPDGMHQWFEGWWPWDARKN